MLQLHSREDVVRRLINILNILKDQPEINEKVKNVCNMNQVDKIDLDQQVDIKLEGVLIPQVVLYFRSQIKILPKRSWLKRGQPRLTNSKFYLKIIDQALVEPLGI